MTDFEKQKQDICDIGKRVYAKGFAAANEGDLSIRVDENTVLCTPTRHCKGFMTPDDICAVDITGKHLAAANPAVFPAHTGGFGCASRSDRPH